ncbi:MAG: mannose-1-phosphate guanylyltransferase [Longimicrobiales bacterium]
MAEPSLWGVILAGGIGSRFWPVSTPRRPKQVLPLAGDVPLIRQTVDRITPLVPLERLRLLAGAHLAEHLREAVGDLSSDQLWIEPEPKGTAPVLAWAAARIAREDEDAVMVSLHSDHVITPDDAFRALVGDVAHLAAELPRLFTIGAQPNRPETGYGYIRLGERVRPTLQVYDVAEFVEKPDRDTAREYLLRGGYLWNTGIFLWRVGAFLDEVRRRAPEIGELLPLLDAGEDERFFREAPAISVDEAVLERSDHVAVAHARFRWDDIGAWDAVGRTRTPDEAGNVAVGKAHLVGSQGCIAWADEGTVVVFGGENLVVVRSGGITLVAPRERTTDLKDLLSQLPEELRALHDDE